MITYLLYRLLRKYFKNNAYQVLRIRHFLKTVTKLLLPILLCLLLIKSYSQESIFEYEVIRNNKVIGHTVVTAIKKPGRVTYKVAADISVSFIKDFKAVSVEETVFEKGLMISSIFSRSLNGENKGKRKTMLLDSMYQIENDGKKSIHHFGKINYTCSSLYLNEPLNRKYIYSDNHQSWLKIIEIKLHNYKLELPNGNYAIYQFENGICTRIDIYETFFNVSLTLISKDQARLGIPITSSY